MVRVREFAEHGVSGSIIRRLTDAGDLVRVARGLYTLPDSEVDENVTLGELCTLFPKAVVCLESALRVHQLGVSNPSAVWLALPRGHTRPSTAHVDVEWAWMGPRSYGFGVEKRESNGVEFRVTSAAKTVVDCFKFRTRVGQSTAIDGLRDYLSMGGSAADLFDASVVCRMQRVIEPYLEALI